MPDPRLAELKKLVESGWNDLDPAATDRIVEYYGRVLAENEVQNLTRLVSPQDFFEGHVLDVKALFESGFLASPAMDLGSGAGVPGLLAAIVRPDSWILCDSEARKTEFLERTAREMGLSHVKTTSERAENYLKDHSVETIAAKAVGPVERIYSWLQSCSTWNKLILFKGPKWEEEWAEFKAGRYKKQLKIEQRFDYTVGAERKKRTLVLIARVPRGT